MWTIDLTKNKVTDELNELKYESVYERTTENQDSQIDGELFQIPVIILFNIIMECFIIIMRMLRPKY